MPSRDARIRRLANGTLLAPCTIRRPLAGSWCASTPRVSIGSAACRCTLKCSRRTYGALAKALGSKDEAFVELTLAIADTSPHRPDQPGPALVASLNGNPIGSLSAGESKARAPFVARLVDNGRPVLALARVKRSSGAKGGLICSVSTPST